MQYYLTTTGTVQKLVLDGVEYAHPVSNLALLEPAGYLTLEEFRASTQLQDAIAAEQIIIRDEQSNPLTPDNIVAANSIPFFGNTVGTSLVGSNIVLNIATINFPYCINLLEGNNFQIDGQGIFARDIQKQLLINEVSTSSNSWGTILSVRSQNTEVKKYDIKVELLLWISRNNKYFDVALFINNQEQADDSLELRFNRANDYRTIDFCNDYILQPDSLVEIKWKRVSSNTVCYAARRKLLIEEALV